MLDQQWKVFGEMRGLTDEPWLAMQPISPLRHFDLLDECFAAENAFSVDLLGETIDAFTGKRNAGRKRCSGAE
jgi:hypothetical protein